MNLYELIVIVILPSILKIIFNSLTFLAVRSSTRRVQAAANATASSTGNAKRQHARDMSLLKHMLFLFVIFVLGWGPIYIISMANLALAVPLWLSSLLQTLPVTSALVFILDLFMYNRDLRQYLQEQWMKCLRINRH